MQAFHEVGTRLICASYLKQHRRDVFQEQKMLRIRIGEKKGGRAGNVNRRQMSSSCQFEMSRSGVGRSLVLEDDQPWRPLSQKGKAIAMRLWGERLIGIRCSKHARGTMGWRDGCRDGLSLAEKDGRPDLISCSSELTLNGANGWPHTPARKQGVPWLHEELPMQPHLT